jgi:hypothetical protein
MKGNAKAMVPASFAADALALGEFTHYSDQMLILLESFAAREKIIFLPADIDLQG